MGGRGEEPALGDTEGIDPRNAPWRHGTIQPALLYPLRCQAVFDGGRERESRRIDGVERNGDVRVGPLLRKFDRLRLERVRLRLAVDGNRISCNLTSFLDRLRERGS